MSHYYTKSISDALNNQNVAGQIVPSKFQIFKDRWKAAYKQYYERKYFWIDIAMFLAVGAMLYVACR